MMKIASLALAAAVAAVIGSAPAMAQSSNNDTGSNTRSGSQLSAPTHPQNEWARDRDWYARPGWAQGAPGYGRMGPWMMGGGPGWMMGHHRGWMGQRAGWRRFHHRPRGAHFSFRRGNAHIDIQCPANQSVKACVDAASTLIDKVARMGPPPPPRPGQPKPPANTNGAGKSSGGNAPNGSGNHM